MFEIGKSDTGLNSDYFVNRLYELNTIFDVFVSWVQLETWSRYAIYYKICTLIQIVWPMYK